MPQSPAILRLAMIALFILSPGIPTSEGAFINLKVYENEWLRKILTEPLNNVQVRPTILNTSEPIEISVSLVVLNFEAIDDKKQEYSIQVTLQQEWEDDRLAYAKFNPVQLRQIKYLTLLEPDKIWNPDTFFKNSKTHSVHSNMNKATNFARIFANGTVRLETRLSLTLSCPMNLRYFPFEHTICDVQIASHGFARDDLIYKWKPLPTPITIRTGASHPPEFVFDSVTSNYCDAQSGNGGVFSCLLGEFHFHRSHSFYLKQTFIPLANLVFLTWFSFLLDYRRVLLLRGLLCMLTFSMAFSLLVNISRDLPRLKYSTALDVWNGISLTFIFAALIELLVVHYVSVSSGGLLVRASSSELPGSGKSSKRNSTFDSSEMVEMTPRTAKLVDVGTTSINIEPENVEAVELGGGEGKKSVQVQTAHWTRKVDLEKIERWTKLGYAVGYAGFNVIFWLVCCNSGDH